MPDQKQIIILEDDAWYRGLLLEAIQMAQQKVTLTIMDDCEKLLATLSSLPAEVMPSLLVLNHDMQGMEVRELINKLRTNELCKDLAFMVYTDKPVHAVATQYQELNALAVFKKETNSQKVVEQINFISQFALDGGDEV